MARHFLTFCLIALASAVFSAGANAQRSAADIIQQHVSGIQGQVSGGQFSGNNQQHLNGQHWGGNLIDWGSQYWNGGGNCGGGIILPPPPPQQHCYIYYVYYLDYDQLWKLYGEYHSRFDADQATNYLRQRGYRTYMKIKSVSSDNGIAPSGR